MPTANRKFRWTGAELIRDAFGCLVELNPDRLSDMVIAAQVARLRDAQPISAVRFVAKISLVLTGINGLKIADTCFYYPDDSGIPESVRLGRDMARAISS